MAAYVKCECKDCRYNEAGFCNTDRIGHITIIRESDGSRTLPVCADYQSVPQKNLDKYSDDKDNFYR